jgi:hypothetical protein
LGLKTRLELNNLLDSTESRDRLIYSGRRGLSVLERRQLEDEKEGREIELILSGTF